MAESEFGLSHSQKFLQPTLQTVLIRSWDKVLEALGDGEYMLAWERVQTFFEDVVPTVVYKECKEEYESIRREFDSYGTDSTAYEDIVSSFSGSASVLQKRLREFMRKVKDGLFEHNYLENPPVGPRVKGESHL